MFGKDAGWVPERFSKVVVTGARGFIGRSLVNFLNSSSLFQNSQIVSIGRDDLDLADRGDVFAWMNRVKPSTVVHLASSLTRGSSADTAEIQWKDTLVAGKNLLEACSSAGVTKVLVAGSLEEFGLSSGAILEEMPARPMSYYGLNKHLLFEIARYYASLGCFQVDWFRPFVVYGPAQTGNMLIPYAFRCAVMGEVGEFGDGTQLRDFVFVDDVVKWIVGSIASGTVSNDDGFRVHHLGTGLATSVKDVLRMITEYFPEAQFQLAARSQTMLNADVLVAPRPFAKDLVTVEDGIRITAMWWRAQKSELRL